MYLYNYIIIHLNIFYICMLCIYIYSIYNMAMIHIIFACTYMCV